MIDVPRVCHALATAQQWGATLQRAYPCAHVRVSGDGADAWIVLTLALVSARRPRQPGSLASLWWATYEHRFNVTRGAPAEVTFASFVERLQCLVVEITQGPDPGGVLTYLGEAYIPGSAAAT